MALSQTLLWTTLPNGRVTLRDGQSALRVSVLMSPRLTPTARQVLKPFKLFLDWPDVVRSLRFRLVVDGGGGGPLEPVPTEDPLDSDLWQRLFDEQTFVRGHVFTDLKDEVIHSYPATDVYAYVHDLYGQTAEHHGTELPSRKDETGPLGRLKRDLGPLNDRSMGQRLDKMLAEWLRETKVLPPEMPGGSGSAGQATYAFLQARRFYARPQLPQTYREQPDPDYVPAPLNVPEFDFHQALSALADYPRLMRRLGLVVDLALPHLIPLPAHGRLRVEVEWRGPPQPPAWQEPDRSGWTAYVLEGDGFRARSTHGVDHELTRGQLDLAAAADAAPDPKKPQPYLVAQVDVDGSALKTLHTAGSLVRQDRPALANYRTPVQADLPALRTTGLSIYRRRRAAATRAQILRAADAQAKILAAQRPEFFADDLVRGYRIDVWDSYTEEWHPLCLRQGVYRFSKHGEQMLELRDEGYVKGASASRGEEGLPKDLYLHERLATFDGWSLVAPRPGRTLAADPTETEPVVPPENPAAEYGFSTRFSPPAGSLARLRYGRHYRLRVRLVDLAGNSVEFREAGERWASQRFHYRRYEPVPSPVLLLRARVTEGESLEHLVIRSDFDRTATAYAADPVVDAILEVVRDRLKLTGARRAGYSYQDANERHLAPPKISQLEAETHGKFDEFIGPGADHAKGYRLALREAATFLSTTMVDLQTGTEEPIPGLELELVPPIGHKPTKLNAKDRAPGDALQEGEYVLHKEAQLTVPYLPDPFAAGVAFMGLPGWPADKPFIVAFAGEWPDVKPFRLRLVERAGVLEQCQQTFADSGEPQWNPTDRTLTVMQPKAVMTEVRFSSVLPNDEAARQMGLWKWLEERGGLTDLTHRAIREGRHWMFTPWRTLMLVHAVQHPLCPPTIKVFAPSRFLGSTYADLRGTWHLSIKSTDKVDVLAAWQEPVDDPYQPTWQILDSGGHVAELKMHPLYQDQLEVPPPLNPQLPRARHPLRHEFGDTKHRMIHYRLKGTSRFREYFPVELTQHESAITREGDTFLVNIPSSARPSAPRPVCVLPTFRWEETPLANQGLIRRRRGNGLRVYLERPWWSSGDSERLGVVIKPGGGVDEASPLKPYVTQWGLDPAFDSPAPISAPSLQSFPLATATRSNVSLQEVGDQQDIFAVAGHDVEFDPERKLWFADVTVAAGGSYFPFVRLALARFQPHSIEDAHLSRVVLSDFVQLVPDRTLDLRWQNTSKARIKLFGTAPTETYVSRVISGMSTVRSGTINPPATLRDIAQPIGRNQFTALIERPALEALQPGDLAGTLPGVAAEPAAPSRRFGLNEYTVVVEELPEDGSPDFDWQPLGGVTVTKPPPPPPSPRPIDPRLRSRSVTTGRSVTIKKTAGAVGSAAAAASRIPEIGAAGGLPPGALELTPLWEADVTLPAQSSTRRRRIVIREHELYFKATASPGEFIPIARRLVYVDIVELPTAVA